MMPGDSIKGYKYPNRKRTQKHSEETKAKIGIGASATRRAEKLECPYGCGMVSNNGAIARHIMKHHEFVCTVPDCEETEHKAAGMCYPHWRKQQTLYRYGLTVQDYVDLYNSQHGKCSICSRDLILQLMTTDMRTRNDVGHIDHRHGCCPPGQACNSCRRGMLCGQCNVLLGHAKESIETLQSAQQYLERWGDLGD